MNFRITRFQAEEIQGLLDIAEDEQDGPDRDEWPIWGQVHGQATNPLLTVYPDHATAAIENIRHRAEVLPQLAEENGERAGGGPASLQALAERIEAAAAALL